MNFVQKIFLSTLIFIYNNNLYACDRLSDADPMVKISYSKAFDQEAIYKEFADLMHEYGCAQNVLSNTEELPNKLNKEEGLKYLYKDNPFLQETNICNFWEQTIVTIGSLFDDPRCAKLYTDFLLVKKTAHHKQQFLQRSWELLRLQYPNLPENLDENIIKQMAKILRIKQFEQACLRQLQAERKATKRQPFEEQSSGVAISIGAALAETLLTKGAGSIGILMSAESVGSLFKQAYKTFVSVTPPHSLDSLERFFALNKCFIPKELWPKITQKFLIARSSPTDQQECINFIEFALGLRVFQPQLSLSGFKNTQVHHGIDSFFSNFFKDYVVTDFDQITDLRAGVHDFVHLITTGAGRPPFYRYLYSKHGGEGKTYFMKALCNRLNELLNNGLYINTHEVIRSPNELEGDQEKPGALLRNLRGQFANGKHASIMVLDEAGWLGDENFVHEAKRVLNRDLSSISTQYFGTGVDGTGISFEVPPMLLLAAGNNEITDDALRSRFVITNFPAPTKEALKGRALALFKAHRLYREAQQKGKEKEIKIALDSEIETNNKLNNFREIEKVIPLIATNILEGHCKKIQKKTNKSKKFKH